jgi:hypothetical protein
VCRKHHSDERSTEQTTTRGVFQLKTGLLMIFIEATLTPAGAKIDTGYSATKFA